ncbi:MAG TPA: ATP-dependent DNA helicase RecG, partial [Actinomycetales bacterium]|nr:ATP-dependent DNA helicase RecG [Actinomycetales bacterium]
LEALRNVHRPVTMDQVNGAKDTLRWEEAFVLQMTLAQRRAQSQAQLAVARPAKPQGIRADFEAALPFELTEGQVSVGAEIARDLECEHPMQRLLQGEVGSGKTIVALRAMLQVIDAGGQAALLAPTEVLAAQHAKSLATMLGPLAQGGMLGGAAHGTQITLLTGSLPTAARREALLKTASGEAGIVVGTHALLSENVTFADLGLIVVDEQHRFGVEQRDALRAKGVGDSVPHLLVMTATPIPRTVAMTVFGDLEISTLRELPRGRAGIESIVVPASKSHWVDRIWHRVREEVEAGRRVYIVCSRIGDAESEDAADAEDSAETSEAEPTSVLDLAQQLRDHPAFAEIEIEVLHGRLPTEDKDRAMERFVAGQAPVLISTTVIEVGVDVPAATMMVIMDSDRFGVSQLHQLRGRVGRGSEAGLCLLVTTADPASETGERLRRIAATHDGFELAQLDLEVRREGDVLGTAQSGRTSLRLLRATIDAETIAQARNAANQIVEQDADLGSHPALATAVHRIDPERAEFLDRA